MAFYYDDVGVKLLVTVKDQDGTIVDLTGKTVKLLIVGQAEKNMNIESPSSDGKASYVIAEAKEIPLGANQAELKVIDGSKINHSSFITIEVKPNLP